MSMSLHVHVLHGNALHCNAFDLLNNVASNLDPENYEEALIFWKQCSQKEEKKERKKMWMNLVKSS